MDALDVPAAQRALAFSRITAARGIRHLRESPVSSALGALGTPPILGDLLRAMRLRGGWTQGEVAYRVGVSRTAVVRWENGDRLPRAEEIQTLCYVLEAREEELVFLTTGAFTEAPSGGKVSWDEQADALRQQQVQFVEGQILLPGDLFYLTQQHKAWLLATQHEAAKPLLAETLAHYASELGIFRRWGESGAAASRALALVPRQAEEPDYVLRAALMHAEASVYGGRQVTPDLGIAELESFLTRSTFPVFSAWMLTKLGKYHSLAGHTDQGIEIVNEGLRVMESANGVDDSGDVDRFMRQLDYSGSLMRAGRLEEALDRLPSTTPEGKDLYAHEAIARAEIYGRLGQPLEARDWQLRAYAVLKTFNDRHLRREIGALDRFWDSAETS